jgi:hypothetical protein
VCDTARRPVPESPAGRRKSLDLRQHPPGLAEIVRRPRVHERAEGRLRNGDGTSSAPGSPLPIQIPSESNRAAGMPAQQVVDFRVPWLTHMFVMEVIVRPQDRALCASITSITGIMRPEGRT